MKFESLPADTPHVNALAHVKTLVNGNNPFGPNTLLRPAAGSKSAFDPLALSNVPLVFGCGSGEEDIIDIGCCCCCWANTIDLPAVPEKIASDSKSIDEITPVIFSFEMFLLEDVVLVLIVLVFL